MNIDERLEALTMNFEPARRDIQDLFTMSRQRGEIHEQRLSNLEDRA
jgi:hypothetical protein